MLITLNIIVEFSDLMSFGGVRTFSFDKAPIRHDNMEEPQDYLFDLSTESFINNYYLTSVETCINPNGGLY